MSVAITYTFEGVELAVREVDCVPLIGEEVSILGISGVFGSLAVLHGGQRVCGCVAAVRPGPAGWIVELDGAHVD